MTKKKHRAVKRSAEQKTVVPAVEAEVELEQRRSALTRLDYVAAPVIAYFAAVWAFFYTGTSIGWDDLLYKALSQYTTRQTWIMSRYGHIYLQKIFFWLASDSLTGTRLYWCFLFFSTCVLLYWCAKMLAGKRGYIIGAVAVLLFCSQHVFVRYWGGTEVDFTVMFLFTLGTFVYLGFLGASPKRRHIVLMILGLIFFWAVKSKESGICMAVLFLGLGEEEGRGRNIRRFARDIGWVCAVVLIGSVLLMTLDQVFIGDFWFSVRPSTIRGLFGYNIGEWEHDKLDNSWYALLSSGPVLTAFLLYLLFGWKPVGRDNLSRDEMVVWLIPLAVLFFLTSITILVIAHSISRYLMPAVPVICMWAAQFFRVSIAGSGSERGGSKTAELVPKLVISSGLVLFAFIIVSVLMKRTPDWVEDAGWKSLDRFYICVILPLATTGLLMYVVAWRKRGPAAVFVLSLCLFFVVYLPLGNNLTALKQRLVARRSEMRYEPYRVFADELRFDKDVRILVSKDIYDRWGMLGRRQDAHCWIFNVFFNQKFEYDQFIDGTWEDILKGDYTYAFLSWWDWSGIRKEHNVDHLMQNYDVKADKRTQIILLKKR